MASNYNQFSAAAVSGGDLTFKNNGGTDIAAGLGVLIDSSNDRGILLPTASGGVVGTIGVTLDAIPAGKTGRVRVYGTAVCTSHGAVTRGTILQISDTTAHLGQVKTCGAGVAQLGVALNSADDANPVEVLLFLAKNA
jgi:hypothetical protein